MIDFILYIFIFNAIENFNSFWLENNNILISDGYIYFIKFHCNVSNFDWKMKSLNKLNTYLIIIINLVLIMILWLLLDNQLLFINFTNEFIHILWCRIWNARNYWLVILVKLLNWQIYIFKINFDIDGVRFGTAGGSTIIS